MFNNYLKNKMMKTIYVKEVDPSHTIKGHITVFDNTGEIYVYLENLQRVHVNRFWNPLITTRLYPFQIPTTMIDLLIRMSELPKEDYVKFDFESYRLTMTDSISAMLNGVDTNVPENLRDRVRASITKALDTWSNWTINEKKLLSSLSHGGLKPLMRIQEGSHTRYILASTYYGVLTLTSVTCVSTKLAGTVIVDMQRIDLNSVFIKSILADGLNIIAMDDEPDTQERSDVI
jgi:hypothetical protein